VARSIEDGVFAMFSRSSISTSRSAPCTIGSSTTSALLEPSSASAGSPLGTMLTATYGLSLMYWL
jgi:hypothetical protein